MRQVHQANKSGDQGHAQPARNTDPSVLTGDHIQAVDRKVGARLLIQGNAPIEVLTPSGSHGEPICVHSHHVNADKNRWLDGNAASQTRNLSEHRPV